MTTDAAVGFAETCRRVGVSKRQGFRLLREGRFPVPELPRIGRTHRYSPDDIADYLKRAATEDVSRNGRHLGLAS